MINPLEGHLMNGNHIYNIFFSWNPLFDIDNSLSICKCINLMDVHLDKSIRATFNEWKSHL